VDARREVCTGRATGDMRFGNPNPLPLDFWGAPCYNNRVSKKQMEPRVKTRIRRSHLGIRYDLYFGERYCATAYKASEIENIIASLNLEQH